MKKELSLHTKVYMIVFSSLMGLLLIAAVVLWTVLNSYETSRPERKAEEIFNKYFAEYDFAGFLRAADPGFRSLQSDEDIKNTVKEYYDGKELSFMELDSKLEGTKKYIVVVDNKQLASFTLTKSSRKAAYGFAIYELSGGEVLFPEYQNVTVLVPKGYSLNLGGDSIDSSYIVESNIKDRSCDHVLSPAQGILYDKYVVKNLFAEPTVTVKSPDGTTVHVEHNIANDQFKASVKYDDALAFEYTDYCLRAAEAYALYMTNDGSLANLAQYIDKSQPIYSKIRGVDLNWVPKHTGHAIKNQKVSEFYRYSDEIFSVRVNLTMILSRPDYSDHKENIDVDFYLRKSGDKYLIYDIVTNS